jgi:hypothetical protein
MPREAQQREQVAGKPCGEASRMTRKSKKQVVGRNTFQFAGYTVDLRSEVEGRELFVVATCPICGYTVDSSDHGHGEKHALDISKGKIRTHMRLTHKDAVGGDQATHP